MTTRPHDSQHGATTSECTVPLHETLLVKVGGTEGYEYIITTLLQWQPLPNWQAVIDRDPCQSLMHDLMHQLLLLWEVICCKCAAYELGDLASPTNETSPMLICGASER